MNICAIVDVQIHHLICYYVIVCVYTHERITDNTHWLALVIAALMTVTSLTVVTNNCNQDDLP